jgi:hypothetical protein
LPKLELSRSPCAPRATRWFARWASAGRLDAPRSPGTAVALRTRCSSQVPIAGRWAPSTPPATNAYGAAFDDIGYSPSGCGDAATALSDYAPDGLWIDNFCDWGDYGSSITAAFYSFAVPGAVRYNSLRLDVFGNTISPGTKLRGAFVDQATNSIDSVTTGAQVNNMSDGWFNLGAQAATSLVSSSRGVEAAVVTNEVASPSDIGIVQLTVGYSVLQ